MDVILTCFQLGEPFGPLTRLNPVALLPVLNTPLLQHHIELCATAGVKDIHIAAVDHPAVVRRFVGDGARWGAQIRVWTFKDPCDGSETIARLADKLTGPVTLIPVENCLDLPIGNLRAYHASHDRKVTRVLCSNELTADPNSENGCPLIADVVLPEPLDSGVMVVDSPADLKEVAETMVFGGAWTRISSPHSLWAANMACLDGRFPRLTEKLRAHRDNDVWLGHHTSVNASSIIMGPTLVGDFSSVRSEVQIGPYSAIGDSAILDNGAQVNSSLVFDHTYVGQQMNVKDSIAAENIIMNIRIGSWAAVTDPFLIADVRGKLVIPWTVQLLGKSTAVILLVLTAPIWLVRGLLRFARGKAFFAKKKVVAWDYTTGAEGLNGATTVEHLYFDDSGKFISRLPGLIDVVKGRLALVGVRPLEEADDLTYTEDWAKQRFQAPAGLFTPVDAEAMDDGLEEEKVIAENLYATQRSFRQDLSVLGKSIRNLVFNGG
jgi:NDP-sugar pyrophosphorylase family protein